MIKHRIGSIDDFAPGTLTRVEVGKAELCVARTQEAELYVVSDRCSHEGASLSDGDLYGNQVECPMHSSAFDLSTGAVRSLPALSPIRAFRVTVEAGSVYVEL
jgi:3-phenylpropionate/trans-cinnamate dioxygenase ferredoxin subunit